MTGEDEVESIATEILAYLHHRPMASDSLDGIIHWWLVQQSIMKNKDLVEQALKRLAEEGKITMRVNANSETVYGLDPGYKSDLE